MKHSHARSTSLVGRFLLLGFLLLGLASCQSSTPASSTAMEHPSDASKVSANTAEQPLFGLPTTPPEVADDQCYVTINDNRPFFTNEQLTSLQEEEHYGELDALGRVTGAEACLSQDLMPSKPRGPIDTVKPTGWHQARYPNIPQGWLYNRCHLIGYQLTGQNANPKNLMTGTRWLNVEGMLPFENFVAHTIEKTGFHVRYRVTPLFVGKELVARGLYMEGFSLEDNGKSLCFCLYVPNRQPEITIDYQTGKSHA